MKEYVIVYDDKWYTSRDDRSLGGWTRYKKRVWLYYRKKDALSDLKIMKRHWRDTLGVEKRLVNKIQIKELT